MLLMMGGQAPETCRATRKHQVINLWNCCILLADLFESYDDAQTCERQTTNFTITVPLFLSHTKVSDQNTLRKVMHIIKKWYNTLLQCSTPQTFFRPILRFSVLLAVGTIACRPCAIVHYHSRVSKVLSALFYTCCFYHLESNSKLQIINNDIHLQQ